MHHGNRQKEEDNTFFMPLLQPGASYISLFVYGSVFPLGLGFRFSGLPLISQGWNPGSVWYLLCEFRQVSYLSEPIFSPVKWGHFDS